MWLGQILSNLVICQFSSIIFQVFQILSNFVNFSRTLFRQFCQFLSNCVKLCQIRLNSVKFGVVRFCQILSNFAFLNFVKFLHTLSCQTWTIYFTFCLLKLFPNFPGFVFVTIFVQFNSRDSVGRVSLFLLSNKAYFFTGTEFTVSWDQNFLPSMSCLWRSCLFYETRIQNKSSISCRNAAQEKCLILSSLLAQQLPFVRWWRKKVDYLLEKSEKEFSTFLHLFFHFFFHFYFHSFSSWRMYFTIKRWK